MNFSKISNKLTVNLRYYRYIKFIIYENKISIENLK